MNHHHIQQLRAKVDSTLKDLAACQAHNEMLLIRLKKAEAGRGDTPTAPSDADIRRITIDALGFVPAGQQVSDLLRFARLVLARFGRTATQPDHYKAAYDEWMDKTAFIHDHNLSVKYLGWHRADIMRDLIENDAPQVDRLAQQEDADKVFHDAIVYGTGVSVGGKHVDHNEIFRDADKVEAAALKLYAQWTDSQGVHCNRFPSWYELSEPHKQQYRDQARAKQHPATAPEYTTEEDEAWRELERKAAYQAGVDAERARAEADRCIQRGYPPTRKD